MTLNKREVECQIKGKLDNRLINSKNFYLNQSEAKERFSLDAGSVRNPQEVFKCPT
jgi:hypothetical protein